MGFYKEHYDVVIIGGSLAGMSAALQLQSKGVSSILVLEKGNFPGGQAAGYTRNGFDAEVVPPKPIFWGTEKEPSAIGRFFHDMGLNVDLRPFSERCRVVLPDFDIDVTLHAGYERAAREINAAVPGTYDGVIGLMNLCRQVYDSMAALSVNWPGKVQLMLKHPDFVKTAGYSAAEIIATFHLPQKAIDILSARWVYMGYALDTTPFTEYALWMAEYFAENRFCGEPLAGLALKMQKKAETNGAQVEFCQEVEKILVKNGSAFGVRTAHGDEIHCDYVISTTYPDKVFTQMVEPLSEVPQTAVKSVNSQKLSAAPISVVMMIDGTPEENGVRNYFTFFSDSLEEDDVEQPLSDTEMEHILADSEAPPADMPAKGCPTNYNCISAVCLNYANPKAVPDGYTRLSLTALAPVTAFQNVADESYPDIKRHLADGLIAAYINTSGVDFRPWIVEIEITTPVTISRRIGTWKGGIYGHVPAMEHHAAVRLWTKGEEQFIGGLVFTGIYGASCDDAGMQIPGGMEAAGYVLNDMERKKDTVNSTQKPEAANSQEKTAVTNSTKDKKETSSAQEKATTNSKQRKEATQNGKQN